jgi:hypothetical protein
VPKGDETVNNMAAMSAGDRRSAADETLIAALAAGATHEEAAAVTGQSARKVRRRLARPEFAGRVTAERSALVTRTSSRLIGSSEVAVQTLHDLLAAQVSDSLRLRTAVRTRSGSPSLRRR